MSRPAFAAPPARHAPGPRAWRRPPLARAGGLARLARAGVAALALAACSGGDDDATGPRDVDGRYALTEFAGQPVPVSGDTDRGRVEVRGGTLTLDGGDYEVTFDVRVDGQRAGGLDDAGTYERDGGTLRFESRDGSAFEGAVSGRELTVVSDGVTYGFRRE